MEYTIWQDETVAKTFLEGVRGAIPLATEQISTLLKVVKYHVSTVNNFMDVGCGNGTLGRAILQAYPQAKGVFLDFSETMLNAAREKLANNDINDITNPEHITFIQQDFGQPDWLSAVQACAPFDVIVSGFAIHHQTDERKREIYGEIYQLLKPGGLFLNLEHVASRSQHGEKIFDEVFVDALYSFHVAQDETKTREQIARTYYNRDDKNANILLDVETQCEWLRSLGYVDVDCFFKILEIALFGGVRPN